MQTPIFSTQSTGHNQHIQLFRDKLTLHDVRYPLQPTEIPLQHVKRTQFVPKEPYADPRRVDLMIETKAGKKEVVKDLDLEEARQLESMLAKHQAQAPPTNPPSQSEQPPITYRDRILRQLDRQKQTHAYQAIRNKFKAPRLTFRRRIGLILILPLTLFGQVEITAHPAPESALLMNLPNVYLLPNSPLYPLKEWWEKFRLVVNPRPNQRVEVLADLARGHLAEVITLAQKGNLLQAAYSLAKYQDLIDQLNSYQDLLPKEKITWFASQVDQQQEYQKLLQIFLRREGIQL